MKHLMSERTRLLEHCAFICHLQHVVSILTIIR